MIGIGLLLSATTQAQTNYRRMASLGITGDTTDVKTVTRGGVALIGGLLVGLAADGQRAGGVCRPVPGVTIGFGNHGGIAAIRGRELEATRRGLQVCFAQGSFPLAARRREVGGTSIR